MFKHQITKLSTTCLVAWGLGSVIIFDSPSFSLPSSGFYQAQLFDNVVPSGTIIALESLDTEKFLLLPNESLSITLKVAQDVSNNQGYTLIPVGAEVSGRLEPDGNGTRFIAEFIQLPDGRSSSMDGVSRVVTRTEVVEQGANNRAILQGAVVGASAATLISGVTGDKKIRAGEVFGGAGLGALIGYAFRGQRSQKLISINPQGDLDITLRSDLNLSRNSD